MVGNGSCNATTNNVFWGEITENIVNKGSWMTCLSTRLDNMWQVRVRGEWI